MFDRVLLKQRARSILSHFTAKTIPITIAAGLIIMCFSAVDAARTAAPMCQSGFTADPNIMFNEKPQGSFLISLLSMMITGAVETALAWFYISFVKNRDTVSFSTFLEGFSLWIRGILAALWTALWTCLWTLLLIIPGIVKTIAYSQIYIIIAENPHISVRNGRIQ